MPILYCDRTSVQRRPAYRHGKEHEPSTPRHHIPKLGTQAHERNLQDAQAQQKEEGVRKFTPEQIKIYTSKGGAPHLDGDYTVFGEVIEGMDAVSRIEAVKTNKADRPIENIRILKATIINEK